MSDADIILDEVVEQGRLVSLAEVKQMLEEAAETREEMTYEQKIALEHARRFARLEPKKAEGLVKDLQKAFPDLDPAYAYKIADLVPQHPDDVRSILQRSGLDLSDDDCEKVLESVDKYYVA